MKRGYLAFSIILLFTIDCKSFDGWEKIPTPLTVQSFCAYFIDENTGWATSFDGEIAKTTDGGDTWKLFTINVRPIIYDIQFANYYNGWFASSEGIFFTNDGGESWIKQNLQNSSEFIYFINIHEGWSCNSVGKIFKTTDGGNNWFNISLLPQKALLDIQFADSLNGWVLSWDGSIYHTQNGGIDWIEQISNSGSDSLMKLYFVDQNYGWAVGYHGLVYTTSDGGENWSKKDIEEDVRLNSLCFVNIMTGWIVGDSGSIYRTEDGGITWEKQISNETRSLWFVQFVDANNGWICGYMLDMLRTKTGGTSSIETSYVDNIDLSISPNPASDYIEINVGNTHAYSLQQDLKIYNSLGECVINESIHPMTSRHRMKIEHLPPCLYFLCINNGKELQTASFIVLR